MIYDQIIYRHMLAYDVIWRYSHSYHVVRSPDGPASPATRSDGPTATPPGWITVTALRIQTDSESQAEPVSRCLRYQLNIPSSKSSFHLESWGPDMNSYIVIWRHMPAYDGIWFDHISYDSIWRHMTVYLLPRTSRFFILQRIVLMFDHACSYLPCTLHRILPSKVKKPMCRPCLRKIRISLYILV